MCISVYLSTRMGTTHTFLNDFEVCAVCFRKMKLPFYSFSKFLLGAYHVAGIVPVAEQRHSE